VSAIAIDVLVSLAVALELACCLGLVLARDGFDRLHFVSAGSTVPPLLLAVAVIVDEGALDQASLAAIAVALLLLVVNPVLVHATALSGARRRLGPRDS
jgi:multisubunit Na+/H+ antiporter MnhG subunit